MALMILSSLLVGRALGIERAVGLAGVVLADHLEQAVRRPAWASTMEVSVIAASI